MPFNERNKLNGFYKPKAPTTVLEISSSAPEGKYIYYCVISMTFLQASPTYYFRVLVESKVSIERLIEDNDYDANCTDALDEIRKTCSRCRPDKSPVEERGVETLREI